MTDRAMHYIQKYILRTLTHQKWGRFRDMRPERVDSNLYNYHLKQLLKEKMVEKVEGKGYRLSPTGIRYVDHISLEKFEPRRQPKLMTKILIYDEQGRILLWLRKKQPFIGIWSLPSGKIHYEDESVEAAAQRELIGLFGTSPVTMDQCGVIEFDIFIDEERVSHTVEHIFELTVKATDLLYAEAEWCDKEKLSSLQLAPGTREVVMAVKKHDDFFYEKHHIQW